jgi:hypothetical protein
VLLVVPRHQIRRLLPVALPMTTPFVAGVVLLLMGLDVDLVTQVASLLLLFTTLPGWILLISQFRQITRVRRLGRTALGPDPGDPRPPGRVDGPARPDPDVP